MKELKQDPDLEEKIKDCVFTPEVLKSIARHYRDQGLNADAARRMATNYYSLYLMDRYIEQYNPSKE